MSNPSQQKSWPFARWFFYLLIGVLLTLAGPYASRPGDRFYSTTVATFERLDGILQPTRDKIWLDALSYAKLQSGYWLRVALAAVAVDALVMLILRTRQKYRQQPPAGSGRATPASASLSRP